MTLRSLQTVFVVSWLLWACLPLWGIAAFAAVEVLFMAAVATRTRDARNTFETTHAQVAEALSPEALAWVRRFPVFYVSRVASRDFGRTLKAISLSLIGLAVITAARTLLQQDPWILCALVPMVGFFFLNVVIAGPLEADELIQEDRWKRFQPQHDEVVKAMAARVSIDWSKLGPPRLGAPGGGPPSNGPAEPSE